MKTLTCLFATLIGWTLCTTSLQADFVLESDAPVGTPLVTNAGFNSSAMTIRVFDQTNGSNPEDNVSGFNVMLMIEPQSGATGTLTFASPLTGSGVAEPSNYLFASVSNFGLDVTNTGSEIVFFDFDDLFSGGVDVGGAPGFNMIDLTFEASMDASGLFNIVAVPGTGNTEWTDSAAPTQMEQSFVNVPSLGGNVAIGQVSVTAIPEPSGLLLCGAVAMLAWLSRRHVPCISHDVSSPTAAS